MCKPLKYKMLNISKNARNSNCWKPQQWTYPELKMFNTPTTQNADNQQLRKLKQRNSEYITLKRFNTLQRWAPGQLKIMKTPQTQIIENGRNSKCWKHRKLKTPTAQNAGMLKTSKPQAVENARMPKLENAENVKATKCWERQKK